MNGTLNLAEDGFSINTLVNCFLRMLASRDQDNLLTFGSLRRGLTSVLTFSGLRVKDQKL